MRKSKRRSGLSLIELLTTISIILMLAGMALPAASRALTRSKVILKKVQVFHNQRMEAFGSEKATESDMMWHATNTPASFAPDIYVVSMQVKY